MKIRSLGWGLLVVSVVLLPAAAPATITDDIDPVDRFVHVRLVNPDPAPDKGWLEVSADLGGGKTAVDLVAYSLGPGQSTVVTAEFESTVVETLETRIIENPDPIP